MAQTPSNKSALHQLRRQLEIYARVLPSLDLKRRQLAVHLADGRARLERLEAAAAEHARRVGLALPGLADERLQLDGWAELASIRTRERTLLGVKFPALESVEIRVQARTVLATPVWLECLQQALAQGAERRAEAVATAAECRALEAGLRQTQQRLNLFEKRLIPQTRAAVRRIEVVLDDASRAAVVRAKIAKRHNSRPRPAPP